jgi:NADH dehydrogenase
LSARAAEIVTRMGVTLRLGARVTKIDAEGAHIGDERIRAATVLWAAGVRVTPLVATIGAPLDKQGRVIVEADLSVPGHAGIQVVGDAAHVGWRGPAGHATKDDTVPGMCPGAIQMGEHAARNVLRRVRGQPAEPFRYRDKGSLAAIGRSQAVASIGRVRTAGFWAWVLWVFVHIFYLIGFRNRLAVLFDWGWLFLTRQRGARVIVGRRPD